MLTKGDPNAATSFAEKLMGRKLGEGYDNQDDWWFDDDEEVESDEDADSDCPTIRLTREEKARI